jgi:hypothetical protein
MRAWTGERAIVNWDGHFVWTDVNGRNRHELNIEKGHYVRFRRDILMSGTPEISRDKRWWFIRSVMPDNEITYWIIDLKRDKVWQLPIKLPGNNALVASFSPDSRTLALFKQFRSETDAANKLYLITLNSELSMKSYYEPLIYQVFWSLDSSRFVTLPREPYDSRPSLIARDGTVIKRFKNFPFFDYQYYDVYWTHFDVDWAICR